MLQFFATSGFFNLLQESNGLLIIRINPLWQGEAAQRAIAVVQ